MCVCLCMCVCVYISQKGNRLLGLIGGTGRNYLAQLSKKLRYLRVLHFPSSSIFALIRPLLYISFLLLLSLLKRTHGHSQTGTHHYRTVATYKHNHETRFVKNLEQIGMFRSFLDVGRGGGGRRSVKANWETEATESGFLSFDKVLFNEENNRAK